MFNWVLLIKVLFMMLFCNNVDYNFFALRLVVGVDVDLECLRVLALSMLCVCLLCYYGVFMCLLVVFCLVVCSWLIVALRMLDFLEVG